MQLLGLSEVADVERATGFNPSGIPCEADVVESASSESAPADVSSKDDALSSAASQSTHTSSGARAKRSPPGFRRQASSTVSEASSTSQHARLSEDEAVAQLAAIFVGLNKHEISLAVKRAKNDFDVAVEDLLNIQLLKDAGELPMGIDAFAREDDSVVRKPKGKKKRRQTAKEPKPSDDDFIQGEPSVTFHDIRIRGI